MNDTILQQAWQELIKTECLNPKGVRRVAAERMHAALGIAYDMHKLNKEYIDEQDFYHMYTPKTTLSEEPKASIERLNEIYENSLPHSCVQIINAEDTADEKPDNETSWREYWENRTGKDLDKLLRKKNGQYRCPGYAFHGKEDDGFVDMKDICGCHVYKCKENGEVISKEMYIVPMCRKCNQRKDIFQLPLSLLLKLK